MKPRRLQSATISSRVGPAAVESFTRGKVPVAPGRLLRLDDLLELVAELVAHDDGENPVGALLPDVDGALREASGHALGAVALDRERKRPLLHLEGLRPLAVHLHAAPALDLALGGEPDALRQRQ